MDAVTCRSGLKGWRGRLRANYTDFEEFEAYDALYGLAERLGFASAEDAWLLNPLIEGSVNPADYRRVTSPTKHRKQLRQRGLLLLLVALSLPASAQARPPYKDAFDAMYGINVDEPKEQWQQDLKIRVNEVRCNICHVPNRPKTERNDYGSRLEGLLPPFNDPAFRDPVKGKAAFQEVYKALKAVEPEVGRHRYRFGELIRNGYLPMYDK